MRIAERFILLLILAATSACIEREPEDPLDALLAAAGIPRIIGSAQVDSNLNLRSDWMLGCETRMGNLVTDAFAAQTGSSIAVFNGGAIRDDQGLDFIPAGTVTGEQIAQTIFFRDRVFQIRIAAFRLKQSLEEGVSRLGTTATALEGADADADGAQHGNCFFTQSAGNGRFLHLSSNLQMDVRVANQAQITSGSAASDSLQITTPGRRVVRLTVNGSIIYDNADGDPSVGWSGGAASCSTFTLSAACNSYVLALGDFIARGNDGHPTFDPNQAEVSNDGTVIVLSEDRGVDQDIVLEYLMNLTMQGTPARPLIEGRINIQ